MKKIFLHIIILATAFLYMLRCAYADEISRPITAWPLISSHSGLDSAETEVLFGIYHFEREKTWTRYAVNPFIFSTEADSEKDFRKTSILWRLSVYKREQERSRFHLFPLYWYKKTPETGYNILPPVFWSGYGESYSYTHLWPLYSRQEHGSYREYGSLYPLIRFGRDPKRNITLDQFLLYYHKQEPNRSLTTIFPVYGRQVEGQEKKTWLIPVYYNQSEPDSLLTFALPVLPYYHRKAPGLETLHVWPVFSKREKESYREYGSLYPLIRFGRDHEHNIELDQVLLYYHKREADRSFTTAFPLYWSTADSVNKQRFFIPLYYHHENQDSLLTLALPVLPYYHRKDPVSESLHLWPVFSKREYGSYREYGSLYPLIRFGRDNEREISIDHFLLYYHKREADNSCSTLFPIWFSSRKPETEWDLILPVYYARKTRDESSRLVLPLLYFNHETPNVSVSTVVPLYFNAKTRSEHFRYIFPSYFMSETMGAGLDMFIPFYLRYASSTTKLSAITPLYMKRESNESRLTTLLPVYFDYERKNFGVTVGLPVYLRYRSDQYLFSMIFPAYFHSEDAERQTGFSYYFPFYGEYWKGDTVSRHFLLFPLYSHFSDQELQATSWDVLWPLVHYESTPTTRSIRIPPLYWHGSRPDNTYTVFLPFYWSFSSGENNYRHVFPFYGVHKEGDAYTKRFVFGPLFMDTRDTRAGRSQQDALFWLYSRRVEGEKKMSWFFPVYYHRSDPDSLLTFALPVLPYYHTREQNKDYVNIFPVYSRTQEKSYTEYSFFYPLTRFARDPERNMQIDQFLPYYHRRQGDYSFTTVFPIYWSTTEGAKKKQALIPLYYHRENPDSLATLALPVLPYYHKKQPGSEVLHVWPVFSKREKGSYREYGSLYPLIRFGRDQEHDIELDQVLLYFHKREADRSFTTAFPLYWSTADSVNKQRLFIPLYYHHENQDSLLTLALPVLPYYHRKAPGLETLHVWPVFSKREKESYREYGTLYPLIRFGRDPEHDIALDQFLLYYHEREADRSFTTLFPLFGRKTEGLNTASWFIPLYYSRSDPESYVTLAPFYYHNHQPARDSLHAWPLFSREERGSYVEYGTLYPLIRFGRNAEDSIALDQFLLYYHKREGENSFSTVFPVWWHRETGEKTRRDASIFLHWYERDEARDATNLSILWLVPPNLSLFRYHREGNFNEHRLFPLYSFSYDRERDAMNWSVLWFLFSYSSEGEFAQQTGFLWKVVSYERKDTDTYDFRFLWRFIRKSKTATTSTFEFNPFYYNESEKGKGSYWAVLGGLIGVETTPDKRKKLRLFWIF